MTNEQLHVLLLNITGQLQRAVDSASEALKSTDAPFETEEIFIGSNIFSLACSVKNPRDYRTIKTTPTALNEMISIIGDLTDHANSLVKDKK